MLVFYYNCNYFFSFGRPRRCRGGRAFRWAGRHALRGAPDPPDLLSGVRLRFGPPSLTFSPLQSSTGTFSANIREKVRDYGLASLRSPPLQSLAHAGPGNFRRNALLSFLDDTALLKISGRRRIAGLIDPKFAALLREEHGIHAHCLLSRVKKSTTTFKRMATCILLRHCLYATAVFLRRKACFLVNVYTRNRVL